MTRRKYRFADRAEAENAEREQRERADNAGLALNAVLNGTTRDVGTFTDRPGEDGRYAVRGIARRNGFHLFLFTYCCPGQRDTTQLLTVAQIQRQRKLAVNGLAEAFDACLNSLSEYDTID